MEKYHDTFGFFDTIEQAENFKARLLNHYKNNRHYMKNYADKITIGRWTTLDNKDNAFVVHYYCRDDWEEAIV